MTHLQASAKKRVLFFDQIKALMIALVIVQHVLLAILVPGVWFGVHIPIDGSTHPVFTGMSSWLLYFFNAFFMYMLFLISGYFVPRSVHKKGVAHYLKDRLIRLGVPFVTGMLLINNSSVLLSKLSPSSYFAKTPWRDLPLNTLFVL